MVERSSQKVMDLLKVSLRPEFLNRIDEVAIFEPLSRKHIHNIVEIQLNALREELLADEIDLDFSKQAVDYLAEAGYDPEFGARPVKRIIQKKVLNKLSKELLHNRVQRGSKIVLDAFEDELVFRKPREVETMMNSN